MPKTRCSIQSSSPSWPFLPGGATDPALPSASSPGQPSRAPQGSPPFPLFPWALAGKGLCPRRRPGLRGRVSPGPEAVVSLHLPAPRQPHGFCGTATWEPGASCLRAGATLCAGATPCSGATPHAVVTLALSGSHNHIPVCGGGVPQPCPAPCHVPCTPSRAVRPGPCTQSCSLHPVPCSLHPVPCTLHPVVLHAPSPAP